MKIKWPTLTLWSAVLAGIIGNWQRMKAVITIHVVLFWIYAVILGLFMGLTLIYALGLMPDFMGIFGIHLH